jgi:archaellum component FlaG (FlaF/FlaG flagellin family)
MLKIIPFTIILLLFAAGALAQPQFLESYLNLSQDEKKIVDTVLDNLVQNHIVFLGEISQVNELIGATAISDVEVATNEKLADSHYELAADVHQKEHLPVIILPAEKAADGTYHTPVKMLGDRAYSYKVLYTVKIQGNYITISSSELSDKHDSRIEIAPDQRLIKNIAKDLKGEVSDNRIKLP